MVLARPHRTAPPCNRATLEHMGAIELEQSFPDILARIETAALGALGKPDLRADVEQAGFQVLARTGAQHAARLAQELPMFRDIIRRAGIKTRS